MNKNISKGYFYIPWSTGSPEKTVKRGKSWNKARQRMSELQRGGVKCRQSSSQWVVGKSPIPTLSSPPPRSLPHQWFQSSGTRSEWEHWTGSLLDIEQTVGTILHSTPQRKDPGWFRLHYVPISVSPPTVHCMFCLWSRLLISVLSCTRGKSAQMLLFIQSFVVWAWACHQPHETPRALGFLTCFAPWYHSFSRPSWPVAVCILSIVCAHLCFAETVLYHVDFPTEHRLSRLDPPNSLPLSLSLSLLYFFPSVHSPGDIWISNADHYMVTAPAFTTLRREVASLWP